MYFLDVVTSPVAWAAFALGVMFSGACLVAVMWWFVPWYERASGLVQPTAGRNPDPTWQSPSRDDRWICFDRLTASPLFWVSVVDEEHQATYTASMTIPTTRSLADWLNQQLKGVPQ
jgi:hypothetical protein